ncbi:MAG: 2-hydroxyacyl-CoA dehydratase [Lachnospiraceae bacterium]|nr:2-hydroxyacyl-CoA dehydratase [Lachnospiraceae bacterium]
MDIARTYGDIVRRQIEKDGRDSAAKLIRAGLHLEGFRCRYLADKALPASLRFLNERSMNLTASALDHPERLAYTNIFAPVELLMSFGLTCVSMENISSFLAGFYLEDLLTDKAETLGIAGTLCSYHRTFIGAVETGLIPTPAAAVTTTTVCDGNVGTFRWFGKKRGVGPFILDIPYRWSPEAESYVENQLTELAGHLQAVTGKPYDEDLLKLILERENRGKQHYLSFLEKRQHHRWPSTISLNVYQLFATHLSIGAEWTEQLFARMDEEVESFAAETAKRLFWVHIQPYPQPSLREYINTPGRGVAVCADDFNLDYTEPLDVQHPLKALARKMILNIYNGPNSRKVGAVEDMVRKYKPDGVVQFAHWGCRQSAGGAMELKERMKELGVPMLVLDGDAIDRRNSPDGQIRTRFEAFLEVIG